MMRYQRRGQGMVEYTLIVAMMACIIIGAATAVGVAVRNAQQKTANTMQR